MLSFSWSPDGRSLLFGSMTGAYASRGIRTLELASGRWSSLSYEMGADDFDYAPQYSPDGSRIGFVRNPQVGDLWVMDADGGNADRLTNDAAEIRGWSWLHSDEIVFGRRVDSESRLYRLDVATRTLSDMGVDDARNPTVSRHGGNIAFTRDRPQFGLFRVPLTEGGDQRRVRLFASSGRDAQPMVSPDGTQLAFTSDRSGTFALWWGRLDDPDSLRVVEGLRPEARQPMDWSSDARTLLVSGRDAEGLPGIYEVVPEDGRWKKLAVPVGETLQAIYGSAPGTLLVVERGGDERMTLTLFDRTQTPWKRMASLEGVSQARLDRAGNRVLFTRLASGGLWQVGTDLAPDSILSLNSEVPTRWRYRTWAVAGSGMVGYMSIGTGCATHFSVIAGGGASRCLDADRFSSGNGMSLAPDGSAAFIALGIADGADIGVMRVPKRAPRRMLGVAKWLPWLEKPLS
ncbi:translocation protein TolB [compost metagenome]